MKTSHRITGAGFLLLALSLSFNPMISGKAQAAYQIPNERDVLTIQNADQLSQFAAIKVGNQPISSVALSPDGTLLAFAAYGDPSVHLVDVSTGKETGVLKGHNATISYLVFSPDGTLLASGDSPFKNPSEKAFRGYYTIKGRKQSNYGILLWDTKTRKRLRRLPSNGLFRPAFSPDSTLIAYESGSLRQRTITLQNTETGAIVKTLNNVEGVASFSPDSKTMAVGNEFSGPRIYVGDVATGEAQASFEGHITWSSATAYSPNAGWMASGGAENVLHVWNSPTRQHLIAISGHTGNIEQSSYRTLNR
jgi:WD40 repeat protein